MKYIFFLVCILFASISIQAQDYDIRLSGMYNGNNTVTSERQYESFIRTALSDTTSLETTFLNTILDSFTVEPKFNLNINIGQRFSIVNKLQLRAGLGIDYSFYRTTSRSITIDQTPILSEVITAQNNPDIGTNNFCDILLNSFSDFPEPDRDPKITIANLALTLELIHPIANSLNLGVGTSLNTPIYTLRSTEQINLDRKLVDGQYECEFHFVENKDKSGNGFNNLRLSMNAFLEYELFNKFLFQVGYDYSFNNVYVEAPSSFPSFINVTESYQPQRIYLTAGYYFNRKVSFEEEEMIEN